MGIHRDDHKIFHRGEIEATFASCDIIIILSHLLFLKPQFKISSMQCLATVYIKALSFVGFFIAHESRFQSN